MGRGPETLSAASRDATTHPAVVHFFLHTGIVFDVQWTMPRHRRPTALPEERRQTAMPNKRSTPPPRSVRGVRRGPSPTWSVLLQRALRARQAGEWQEVGRLLPLLATAPDGPPTGNTWRRTGRSGRARPRRRLGRARSWRRWRARPSRPSCVGSWTRWMRLGHQIRASTRCAGSSARRLRPCRGTPWWKRPRTRGPPDVEGVSPPRVVPPLALHTGDHGPPPHHEAGARS